MNNYNQIIPIAAIQYGVCFQFKKGGAICLKHHSYIRNGIKCMYFMNNKLKCAKYKTSENANKRFVILREDISESGRQINRLKIKSAKNK